VRQKHGPLRADILRKSMNAAKLVTVLDFISDYRQLAVQVGRVPWRLFFESGGTNKYAPAKHLNGLCGAALVQMASCEYSHLPPWSWTDWISASLVCPSA
jgi:hypothetical protein